MKKLNMFLFGVLMVSLLSLSSLAASNCPAGGKIKVTLVSAQATLISDIYLKEPYSVLLIENNLANIGRTAEVAYTGTASPVFSILIHGANGTYEHFSNSRYARAIMPVDTDSYYTIVFEDDPSNNSDWDYNDVVLKIEIQKNTCAREILCTDSDGGHNINIKGTLKVFTPTYGDQVVNEYCTDENRNSVVSGPYLEELVCLQGDSQYAYKHESVKCPNGCRDGACIKTQAQSVVFEVGVNNYQRGITYPEGHNEALSRNIPYAFVNVYEIRILGNNQYQGTLKATLNTGSRAYAEVTVQPGEMVDFVGFKDEALARSYTTWLFTTPSYKNFGSNPDQLCQINFNDPSNYLHLDSGYACANSLSTPYYAEGTASINETAVPSSCAATNYLDEGATFNYKLGGKIYKVTLQYTDSTSAKFEVNGQLTGNLRAGSSHTLADGVVLTLDKLLYQNYAGGVHAAWFCMNGKASETAAENVFTPTPATLAVDLANYPKLFIKDGVFNGYLVVGERSKPIDNLALTDIATAIWDEKGNLVDAGRAARLDVELPDPFIANLIVVGRPEENQIVKTLTGVNQASDILKPGESMIALYNNKGFAQLLVMGYSAEDTRIAAKVLARYKNYGLKGTEVRITGSFPNVQISSETTSTPISTTPPTSTLISTLTSTTQPTSTPTSQTEPLHSTCNTGCKVNGNCLPYGTRLVQGGAAKFCDIAQQLKEQQLLNAACQNNYECLSNQCGNGKCIDISGQIEEAKNLFQKFWDWLKTWTG